MTKKNNKIGHQSWDQRYDIEDYIYGTDPNKFLKNQLEKLTPGNILFLGEGEGRNAVFAASLGWKVDAVDFSINAKNKALNLAEKHGVSINYKIQNLSEFVPISNHYDVISTIYLHLDPDLSEKIYSKIYDALKIKGKLILEVFAKEQLGQNSGGPKNIEMLYSLDDIKKLFVGIEFNALENKTINLKEGIYHKGKAFVIRGVGEKSKA